MAIYKIYVNKNAAGNVVGDKILVRPTDATVSSTNWEQVLWAVEGTTVPVGEFTFNGDENYALVSQVRDLLYAGFLTVDGCAIGALADEINAHKFVKPIGKDTNVFLLDPDVPLEVSQTETSLVITASGITNKEVGTVVEDGAGTLTFKLSGIPGSANLSGTDIRMTVSDLESLFLPADTNDKVFTPRLYVFDSEDRKEVLKLKVTVSHPSTPSNAATPTIVSDGDIDAPAVGDTLTVDEDGTWTNVNSADITLTYQWLRDGEAITGATASSYTLTSDDSGSKIAVVVTASADAGTGTYTVTRSASVYSAETVEVA